jgi:DNA-binding response OmpR family regulator
VEASFFGNGGHSGERGSSPRADGHSPRADGSPPHADGSPPPGARGATIHAGELEIHPVEGLALASGRALTLSVREFCLLVALARRQGTIVTREELYRAVWNGQLRAGDRSVDVYVSKLRTKLEAAMPDRRFIHTHPGFGYRFQPQPFAGAAPFPDAARAIDGQRQLSRDFHKTGAVD